MAAFDGTPFPSGTIVRGRNGLTGTVAAVGQEPTTGQPNGWYVVTFDATPPYNMTCHHSDLEEVDVITIDMTPTWSALLPALLDAYRDAETFEARHAVREELAKMAKAADRYNVLANHHDPDAHLGDCPVWTWRSGQEV